MRLSNHKRTPTEILEQVFKWLAFGAIVICNLVPFLWAFLTSIKTTEGINTFPPKFIGFTATLEHYKLVMDSNFPIALRNSIFYSAVTIIVCIICAIMFAYAFTRCKFRGKKLFFYIILFGIPLSMGSAALVVPNYLLFSYVHLINKWYTMPLILVAYNLPMACWVMIGGMDSVPNAIDEAAKIDGASMPYIIFYLIPRLCTPSIACAALLTFIGAWNEYLVASVLITSQNLYPIQVSVYNYLGFFGREWGPLMASSLMAVIPILLVFTVLGKLLISGLTAGAVKE